VATNRAESNAAGARGLPTGVGIHPRATPQNDAARGPSPLLTHPRHCASPWGLSGVPGLRLPGYRWGRRHAGGPMDGWGEGGRSPSIALPAMATSRRAGGASSPPPGILHPDLASEGLRSPDPECYSAIGRTPHRRSPPTRSPGRPGAARPCLGIRPSGPGSPIFPSTNGLSGMVEPAGIARCFIGCPPSPVRTTGQVQLPPSGSGRTLPLRDATSHPPPRVAIASPPTNPMRRRPEAASETGTRIPPRGGAPPPAGHRTPPEHRTTPPTPRGVADRD
jgi:hypothetical protein